MLTGKTADVSFRVKVKPIYNKKKHDKGGDAIMQLNLFDMTREEYHIDKPIRLIELFA